MIFLTYQSVDTLEEISEDKLSHSLWAIPLTNLRDTFTSLFCCAPNRMEVLIVLESEQYHRIDKVGWYQAIKDSQDDESPDPSHFFCEETDDLHSEFLLDSVTLENIRFMVPIAEIGESADILDHDGIQMDPSMKLYLQGLAERIISNIGFPLEFNMAFGMDRKYAEYRCEMQPKKIAFEFVYFPIVFYFFSVKKDGTTFDVRYLSNMITMSANKLQRLNDKFTIWSYNDCSREGFDAVTSEIKQCIIDDKNVVLRFVNGPKIERNELCPCGSGKKFKKCHGFLIL